MSPRVLRIGVVDFLNAWPLWAALENQSGVELVRGVPSVLADKLRADEVDAALISSVEYFRLPAGYAHNEKLCIAADREVRSIRLFTTGVGPGFVATLRKLTRIYTDVASRSSVAQLQIIMRELKVDIPLIETGGVAEKISNLGEDEALLTIGDTALQHIARPSFDLQSEYFSLFRRGFVYALWVYRDAVKAEVDPLLLAAYDSYSAAAAAYQADAVTRFGFSATFTAEYLTRVIQHELTANRRADLAFFKQHTSFLSPSKSG